MTKEELIERQATYDYSDHFDHRFEHYCPVCDLQTIQQYDNHNKTAYTCCNCGASSYIQSQF